MLNIIADVIWVSLPRSEGVDVIDGLLRQRLMQIFSLGRCEKKRQRNKQQRHNSRWSPRSVFLECNLKSQDFGILCSKVTRSVLCGIGFLFPKFGTKKPVILWHLVKRGKIYCQLKAWPQLCKYNMFLKVWKKPKLGLARRHIHYCVIFPRKTNTEQPIQSSVVKFLPHLKIFFTHIISSLVWLGSPRLGSYLNEKKCHIII